MAPKARGAHKAKKESAKGERAGSTDKQKEQEQKGEDDKQEAGSKTDSAKKRKAHESTDPTTNKAPRRSSRGAPKAQPTEQQILNYLLSADALEQCRPEDELKDIEARGKDIRTYAGSELSPFEELLCAVVLSRPISHRLGLRTIRTILNPPYNFTTPKAVAEASPEDRHQAMWDAKTQHKGKTAEQVGLIGEVIAERFASDGSDTSLDKVREQAKRDWGGERDLLQQHIKGLGKTGLNIFSRRVQWLWDEAFPFTDERTAKAVEKLGLPKDPEDLTKIIDKHWGKIGRKMLPEGDESRAKRRAFVLVCDRAISADLEGKTEAVLQGAASRDA